MQATLPLRRAAFAAATKKTKAPASSEINAYLGVRDSLLSAAEELTTEANLHRAWIANEVVEQCLRPAHAPYQAQSLPEYQAAAERQRCHAIKARITELRARLGSDLAQQRRAA